MAHDTSGNEIDLDPVGEIQVSVNGIVLGSDPIELATATGPVTARARVEGDNAVVEWRINRTAAILLRELADHLESCDCER